MQLQNNPSINNKGVVIAIFVVPTDGSTTILSRLHHSFITQYNDEGIDDTAELNCNEVDWGTKKGGNILENEPHYRGNTSNDIDNSK